MVLLRVEIICQDPSLVIFHDIITSEDMRYMKNSAQRKLVAATIVDKDNRNSTKVSNERTQSNAWLYDQVLSILYWFVAQYFLELEIEIVKGP